MDKNDSPPTFRDLPSSYMVSEDLGTGQLVATIKASDPDTIGKLEYSLISGDDGKFLLEKFQGTLRLKDTLDRETKDLYKLLIRVTDGVQFTETTIAIQVRFSTFFSHFSSTFDPRDLGTVSCPSTILLSPDLRVVMLPAKTSSKTRVNWSKCFVCVHFTS